ncbi:DUF262 domain-containing protein [Lysobacter brunescens]|uniref:DUF262 domain-containing protein n=1 Tax=Lysobacter brunescens TaxID=262323 RepID=A0ABW2YHE1_9GAMM
MKMTAGRRALDKIYKRRDRYDIPEWQRGEVWDEARKKALIDSVLRGWKLPKFYFVKLNDEDFEVVDGQQRLTAIYEFFANTLALSDESTATFGGPFYKDLKSKVSDAFDDFEIEYDEIEDASEEELKEFFQRLQQGLPLTSSEKLNSVHSKLRDFCQELVKHEFFSESISVPNTRLAHFDIVAKVTAIEVEGVDAGLRFDDIKRVFVSQKSFSSSSAVAKRLKSALDFLSKAFPQQNARLKNRTIVQSLITFACRIVETKPKYDLASEFQLFVANFLDGLSGQVELGQSATDYDYIRFQRSINANVKTGARTRHEVLLRKAFLFDTKIAEAFSPAAVAASGVNQRVKELAEDVSTKIGRTNTAYAHIHGEDLFKATNKTAQALTRLGRPINSLSSYVSFIDDLYFLFRESVGQRLADRMPVSFVDVNLLRTDLQHDVDHGEQRKVAKKQKKIGETFKKYAGVDSPQLLDPERFVLVQANLLSSIDLDLVNLPIGP